jgi:transketolase
MDYLVKQWKGPAYLRLTRQNMPDLYPKDQPFKPGKLMRVRGPEQAKVVLIASGGPIGEAVQAQEKLAAQGLSVSVWNAHCLKPFDDSTTLSLARTAKAIVTIEDHSVIGGLGTCVAEALATQTNHPPLVKIGVQDIFGESGEPHELYEKHGLSAPKIVDRISALAKQLEL